MRIRELEAAQRQAAEAESQARGVAEASQAGTARIAVLEARLNELQTARARAQSSANDAERAFAAQPTPTWIVDMESRLVHAATDSAAALIGLEPAALRGKSLQELLPGAEFADDSARVAVAHWRREDGSESRLELHRIATSYAGRASWLLTARDVTSEFAAHAREQELATQAEALDAAPEACGIVDGEGRLRYGNRALLALLGVDPEKLGTLTLQSLELDDAVDATVRTVGRTQSGALRDETRWRRPDGVVLDVEVALAAAREDAAFRVVSVRDVSAARRAAERGERDQARVSRLLELTQRASALTETEILDRALQIARELTAQPAGLPVPGRRRRNRARDCRAAWQRVRRAAHHSDTLARTAAAGHCAR